MSIYVVTWELNKEKPNYSEARAHLLARLDQYESIKDSGLDSVRFVSTGWTAHQVSDDLRSRLDENDRLLVTKMISGNHQGWLDRRVWDWINARL